MHESTFHFWVIALILGGVVGYLVGYLDPRISKKSKEEIRNNNVGYLIVIENRFSSETAICLAVGIAIAVLMFFFFNGFVGLVEKTGGTIFSVILAILVTGVIFVFSWGVTVFCFLCGATVRSLGMEKRLKEKYRGISVDYDLDDVRDEL